MYPNGSPVANGLYQFKLSRDAIAFSATSACIAPPLISGNLDANGNLTATFLFNDVLSTSTGLTTFYNLTVKTNQGGQIWNENYQFTGTAANLNTTPPAGSIITTIPITVTVGAVPVFSTTGAAGFFGPGIEGFLATSNNNYFTVFDNTAVANQIQTYLFGVDCGYVIRKASQFFFPPLTFTAGVVCSSSIWDITGTTKILDTGTFGQPTVTAVVTNVISPAVTLQAGVPYLFACTWNVSAGANLAVASYSIHGNNPSNRMTQVVNANATRWGIAASTSAAGVFPASLGSITAATQSGNAQILMPYFEP